MQSTRVQGTLDEEKVAREKLAAELTETKVLLCVEKRHTLEMMAARARSKSLLGSRQTTEEVRVFRLP